MSRILCRHVVEATSRVTGIPYDTLLAKNRSNPNAHARFLLYVATREMRLNTSEMARLLNKDPSSINQPCRRKTVTPAQREKIEAIKLLAEEIAEQGHNRLKEMFSSGVAA